MKKLLVKMKAQRGFTFIETLISLAVLSIAVISIVQMFTLSAKQNAVAADLTKLTTFAQDKMEELKSMKYKVLIAAGDVGSVTTPVSGYYDDPEPDYQRLWEIDVGNPTPGMTTVRVKVISSRKLIGTLKECELVITRST